MPASERTAARRRTACRGSATATSSSRSRYIGLFASDSIRFVSDPTSVRQARSVDRRVTFKQLEADEHHFTHKTRNWGYQSFWKRSEAFYNNPSTRSSVRGVRAKQRRHSL
jgi:hypothetical protein